MLEPGAGLGRGEPARRELRPGGRQQPRKGRTTRLPDELLDRGGHREFPAPDEPLQEFGHERMQPVGPDPAAGLPQDLGRRGDVGAIASRAASARGRRCWPRRAAEQPDGGLAMHAGHGDELVQELVLLGSRGVLVSLPLHGGVLPQARSRHGALLVGIGNRDF